MFHKTNLNQISVCLDLLNLEEIGGEIYVGICLAVNVCEVMIDYQQIVKNFLSLW